MENWSSMAVCENHPQGLRFLWEATRQGGGCPACGQPAFDATGRARNYSFIGSHNGHARLYPGQSTEILRTRAGHPYLGG